MRDFRDAKAMAQTIRATLAARDIKVTTAQSLELIAKAFGVTDWNTLSAAINAASDGLRQQTIDESKPKPEPPRRSDGMGFTAELEATLQRAYAIAQTRQHERATLQHLLLALTEDSDASALLRGCNIELGPIKYDLNSSLDREQTSHAENVGVTPEFQRVIQRSVIQTQATGRFSVDGADIVVSLISEPESLAAQILREKGLSRKDALSFMSRQS